MAEPIPSASSAAETAEDDTQNVPKNAEDRKAAAALNALNANGMSQENGETATKQRSVADQEALDKAMSRLEMVSGASKTKDTTSVKKLDVKKDGEAKKKVKIVSDDVNFLVAQLDLSKAKATDLLRSHDGERDLAIRAFIRPPVTT